MADWDESKHPRDADGRFYTSTDRVSQPSDGEWTRIGKEPPFAYTNHLDGKQVEEGALHGKITHISDVGMHTSDENGTHVFLRPPNGGNWEHVSTQTEDSDKYTISMGRASDSLNQAIEDRYQAAMTKAEYQMKGLAEATQRALDSVARLDALAKGDWDESKHPREHGKFSAVEESNEASQEAEHRSEDAHAASHEAWNSGEGHEEAVQAHADAAEAHAEAAEAAHNVGADDLASHHAQQAADHADAAEEHANADGGSDGWQGAEQARSSAGGVSWMTKADWDESKHPREHGRFSSAGGSQGSVDAKDLKLTKTPHPDGLDLNAHSVKDVNGQVIGRVWQREEKRPSEAAFQGSNFVTRKTWHSDLDGGLGGSGSFFGESTRAKAVEEVARKHNRALEDATKADWDESKHPREHGRFTSSGGADPTQMLREEVAQMGHEALGAYHDSVGTDHADRAENARTLGEGRAHFDAAEAHLMAAAAHDANDPGADEYTHAAFRASDEAERVSDQLDRAMSPMRPGATKAEWDESKHPRGAGGKFSSGGGSGGSSDLSDLDTKIAAFTSRDFSSGKIKDHISAVDEAVAAFIAADKAGKLNDHDQMRDRYLAIDRAIHNGIVQRSDYKRGRMTGEVAAVSAAMAQVYDSRLADAYERTARGNRIPAEEIQAIYDRLGSDRKVADVNKAAAVEALNEAVEKAQAAVAKLDAIIKGEWDESKHARGAGGKFGSSADAERAKSAKTYGEAKVAAEHHGRMQEAHQAEASRLSGDPDKAKAAAAHTEAAYQHGEAKWFFQPTSLNTWGSGKARSQSGKADAASQRAFAASE